MNQEKEIPTAKEFLQLKKMSGFANHTYFPKLMIEFSKLHRDPIKKSRVVVSTEEPGYLKITMDDFKKIFAEEIK